MSTRPPPWTRPRQDPRATPRSWSRSRLSLRHGESGHQARRDSLCPGASRGRPEQADHHGQSGRVGCRQAKSLMTRIQRTRSWLPRSSPSSSPSSPVVSGSTRRAVVDPERRRVVEDQRHVDHDHGQWLQRGERARQRGLQQRADSSSGYVPPWALIIGQTGELQSRRQAPSSLSLRPSLPESRSVTSHPATGEGSASRPLEAPITNAVTMPCKAAQPATNMAATFTPSEPQCRSLAPRFTR